MPGNKPGPVPVGPGMLDPHNMAQARLQLRVRWRLKRGRVVADDVTVSSEISSRITTRLMLDNDPPNLLVDSMAWDSGFRGTGLRVGDQVVAVDGEAVPRPATVEEGQQASSTMVGQYGEYQRWAEAGARTATRSN